MESRFFDAPRETKIGLKSRRVREIGGKILPGVKLQCLTEQGKQLWARVIGRFEKMRV